MMLTNKREGRKLQLYLSFLDVSVASSLYLLCHTIPSFLVPLFPNVTFSTSDPNVEKLCKSNAVLDIHLKWSCATVFSVQGIF